MSKGPFIALCYPSRGLGHDRTSFGAFRQLEAYPHILCPAFGLPLPESHNRAAKDALADPRVTHLWFVETDHVLPDGVLAALVKADAPVVAAPYLMRIGIPCAIWTTKGELALVGLGCTLIRREVFASIPDPPFKINAVLWDRAQDRWRDEDALKGLRSGPDTYFCREVRKAGIPLTMLGPEWQVGHLIVEATGAKNAVSVDRVRMIGGKRDYPYAPPEEVIVPEEVVYLKSPNGTLVMDMVKRNKNYKRYIDAGWSEITKKEFDAGLKAQEAMFDARRAEIKAELEN